MSSGSYSDPIHDRRQAERMSQGEKRKQLLNGAYAAKRRKMLARKEEANALKAKREQETASEKLSTSPGFEKRKREEEQECEEQDTSSAKKIKTETAIISPFTSVISSLTSSKMEELNGQQQSKSPFTKHATQRETSTATPTSKEVSPSTAVTSPEPEESKKQEEEESSFIKAKMENTESIHTNSEVPLPSDAVANQESDPAKVSAADDDGAELDDIDSMFLGETNFPEDGTWGKGGLWIPKASEEVSQPKSIKGMPQVPKEKRKREDEKSSANKKQEREDRELSAYKKQNITPVSTNPASTAPASTVPAPTLQASRTDSPPRRKLLRKGPPSASPQAPQEPLIIPDVYKTGEQIRADTFEDVETLTRNEYLKLTGKEKTISGIEKKPGDYKEVRKAPDATEAQVYDTSTNLPTCQFRAGTQNSEDVSGIKNAQVLKGKLTDPQVAPPDLKNEAGSKVPSRNGINGLAQKADVRKSVEKGQVAGKVPTQKIKKITPKPGLNPFKRRPINTSSRIAPAVQNKSSNASSVPTESINTKNGTESLSSTASRKRKAETEAGNPAKRVKASPPNGLYNFNKACWFNSVVQCLHATPAFREYYKKLGNTRNHVSLGSVLEYDRLEKVGKGAKKGIDRTKKTYRKYLDDSPRVWSFKEELGLFFQKMSKESDEPLISFMINQLFASKVAAGMNGETQQDAADVINPLLKELTKPEVVVNGKFSGVFNPFEFTPGRKFQCECGKLEFESSGSQLTENILYGINNGATTTVEECIERGNPDVHLSGHTCSKCGRDTVTKSRIFEGKAPELLIVRFNRFSPSGKKTNNRVKFSVKDLDLSKFCKQETTYELNAVCLHKGEGIDSGHYKALVHGNDGYWYLADDELVDKVKDVKKEIRELSREGYMFFYSKTKGRTTPSRLDVRKSKGSPCLDLSRVRALH